MYFDRNLHVSYIFSDLLFSEFLKGRISEKKIKAKCYSRNLEILIFELWQEKPARYTHQFSKTITLNCRFAAKKDPVIMPKYWKKKALENGERGTYTNLVDM